MLGTCLENVRNTVPLVHNITNYVTVNDVANILLACGGSPIMSDEPEDVEDITSICGGLNINIGTLNQRSIEGMFRAGAKANALGHVVLLDPVGAGASALRTNTAVELMEKIKFTVIRGNISEIKTLALGSGTTKGVDADVADAVTDANLDSAVKFVKNFAAKSGAIVAVTGAIDLVSDGTACYVIRNGRPEMGKITGTGCQLSGMMTAFVVANPDNKLEAAAAMLREKNPTATIVTTAWDELTGEQILKAMSTKDDFKAELIAMAAKANEEHTHEDEEEEHHHHHHHDDENGVCSCGHHHDHDDDDDEDEHHHDHDEDDDHDEHEHEHHHHHDHDDHDHCCCGHHHDHDDDDDDDEHEHHHDHDGHCCCGHHHHHHDHDADEVFTSWGVETARKFTKAEVEHALTELDTGNYGMILRSKGIVNGGADGWLEFDYVPGEWEVRARGADVGGKLVVIGSKLNEKAIAELFGC